MLGKVPVPGDLSRTGAKRCLEEPLRGAWLQGSKEETASRRREGLSLCLCTTVSGWLFAHCPSHLLVVSLLTAALCSLQGRGGQHPSAGEAAGHRGESLLRPVSPCPHVPESSTAAQGADTSGEEGAGAGAQPQTRGVQQLNKDQNGPCQCVPVGALLGVSEPEWLGCTVETGTEQATGSWEV